MELTSAVPREAALYGIGEHISTSGLLLRREGAPLTLWNRDNAASEPDQNTYGSWPFLIDVRPSEPSCILWVGPGIYDIGFRVIAPLSATACTCVCEW